MRRAILLTGFNNWGKTTHINNLFGQERFHRGKRYSIRKVNAKFTVESHSNDDWGQDGFVKAVTNRLEKSPVADTDLFCAFCPTREKQNNSQKILQQEPFSLFDEVHIILLKYKWDFHAELRETDIRGHLGGLANVRFKVIDADAQRITDAERLEAREAQITDYLKQVYQ